MQQSHNKGIFFCAVLFSSQFAWCVGAKTQSPQVRTAAASKRVASKRACSAPIKSGSSLDEKAIERLLKLEEKERLDKSIKEVLLFLKAKQNDLSATELSASLPQLRNDESSRDGLTKLELSAAQSPQPLKATKHSSCGSDVNTTYSFSPSEIRRALIGE